MRGKLNKTQRRALEWFAEREYASKFGPGDPSLAMIRRLEGAGFLVRMGRDAGFFGFTRFAITEAGRSAISKDEGEGA